MQSSDESMSYEDSIVHNRNLINENLAQIDGCDFNQRPMLVYSFDENIATGSAVCCQECAEPAVFDDCCKPKPKKRACPPPCPRPCPKPCPKPCARPRPKCPRPCPKPKPRCKPCCKPKPRCKPKPCCKPKPRCKPKPCCKPKKPACPKRKPRPCPKRC